MPFLKRNESVKIHFDDASASYMKSLLTSEVASHSDPDEKAMIQELLSELESAVKCAFGPAIWEGL